MTINTNIKISPGNSKMGAIPSVSLPAITANAKRSVTQPSWSV